jgi:hypothetical protein
VSWNCNGAFRKKYPLLDGLQADICVIQECEDPERSGDLGYRAWAKNYLWVGSNKNKGLGIFAAESHRLERVGQEVGPLELFLPCRVNGNINLLAVWTREAKSPTFKYIGQLWKYLGLHSSFLDTPYSALVGDLNSNACWDVWDRWWNHSDVVKSLGDIGLTSIYHHGLNEPQGSESKPTFYMYRRLDKPYHIDYAFCSKAFLPNARLEVGLPDQWLSVSDHMPLIVDL